MPSLRDDLVHAVAPGDRVRLNGVLITEARRQGSQKRNSRLAPSGTVTVAPWQAAQFSVYSAAVRSPGAAWAGGGASSMA